MPIHSMYQHRLWKAKRKEILARDSHTCKQCGATKQLHVHHKRYTGKLWEAPESDLITLCKTCHSKARHDQSLGIKTSKSLFYTGTTKDIIFTLIHVTHKAALIQDTRGIQYWLPFCLMQPRPKTLNVFELNTVRVPIQWAKEVSFPLNTKS